MNKSILYIVILLIAALPVFALGVGPVQVYKVFVPGQQQQIKLIIFNSNDRGLAVNISARGELAPYINFEKTEYELDKGSLPVYYTLVMPSELSPGPHYADIVVTESPRKTGATVEALASTVSRLRVQAPYGEKYAEAKLDIDASENKASFTIYVYNFYSGQLNVSSHVSVIDGDSREIKSLDMQSRTIEPMSEATMTAEAVLAPNQYHAVADIIYDGKHINLEKDFVVGKKLIEITGITVDPFSPGEIAKIRLQLKNRWPLRIEDAMGEVIIIKDNTLISTLSTETFDIDKTREIAAYWNTKDIAPGIYNAKANIIYDGKISSSDFNITIAAPFPEEKRYPVITSIVIVVLIAFVIILVYLWRQRPKERH